MKSSIYIFPFVAVLLVSYLRNPHLVQGQEVSQPFPGALGLASSDCCELRPSCSGRTAFFRAGPAWVSSRVAETGCTVSAPPSPHTLPKSQGQSEGLRWSFSSKTLAAICQSYLPAFMWLVLLQVWSICPSSHAAIALAPHSAWSNSSRDLGEPKPTSWPTTTPRAMAIPEPLESPEGTTHSATHLVGACSQPNK